MAACYRCLDFGFSGVCHHAVPLDSDPRGGAGPCRRLDGVRGGQFAVFCGAHHPPRDDMDCRPDANVELGLLLAMVRHGSRRQSQLDSASEPLERKYVVDVHRVLSVVSRASCRTLSTRRCSLATRTPEMARSASETLLSSATARTARFSSIHHAWDHTTVFLCCASSRGRHSKCRGGSCSRAVVFLLLSNRQRSTCSCPGCGTSGDSRTARDLCARASGELHLAPYPQFTIVLSLSSTVLGCGLPWVLKACQGQNVVMMSCGHAYKAS